MQENIISLKEITTNHWVAKYRGNYGVYAIDIHTDNDNTVIDFDCSCPSDYYPCKHIPIIEEAIIEHLNNENPANNKTTFKISIKELISKVPHEELINFVASEAKYNSKLNNSILVKFAHKSNIKEKYSSIIKEILSKFHFDLDDLYYSNYYDDSFEIDDLEEWFKRAEEHIENGNYEEAIAIAQACLEEFAKWNEEQEDFAVDYIDETYYYEPFEILVKASESNNHRKEIFQYCINEMKKAKYKNNYFETSFHYVLGKVAGVENADTFIKIQTKLFNSLPEKNSYDAEEILNRLIDFHNSQNQPELAWKIIIDNIQINDFRKRLTEKYIQEQKFQEAKKLIADHLKREKTHSFYNDDWYELLLEIAQKENDKPLIRSTSYIFIKNSFNGKYYRIYKSTFSDEEWNAEFENLIKHYSQRYNFFNNSIADILKEEKLEERLLKYIESNLRIEYLEQYFYFFHKSFPEQTLVLFQKALNEYVANNVGRKYYEYVAEIMKKMKRIKGGTETVNSLLYNYRIAYKNRRAMMEVLSKI